MHGGVAGMCAHACHHRLDCASAARPLLSAFIVVMFLCVKTYLLRCDGCWRTQPLEK